MSTALYNFWGDEEGQDLIEYSLLITFVALGAIGLMQTQGTAIKTIWGSTSTLVGNAATVSTS